MHSPVRLLAIDLDGTLFDPRQQISPRNVAAINRARRAGVEICIATGRRHTFAWRNLAALELAPDDIILSSNGAVVRRRDGSLLARTQLPHEISVALCAAAGEHRSRLVFTFDKVDQAPAADRHSGSLLIERADALHGPLERWLTDNRADILEIEPIEAGLTEDRAIQAMISGEIAPMRELELRMRESSLAGQVAMHRTEYPSRSLSILDILPAGSGKGVALAALAAERNLARSQVAAIGDNFNDFGMLQFAGQSYVMANGAPEMVADAALHGWTVAPTNEEDGVAIALEELLGVTEGHIAAVQG